MTIQTLKNKSEIPPDGFRFFCKETEIWIKSPSWTELLTAVKKHYKSNALPISLLFEQDIENQLCSFMPPGVCKYSDPSDKRRAALIHRPTVEKAIELTKLFFKRATGQAPHVSSEQAYRQARICSGCQFNQEPTGCSSCNAPARAEAVAFVLGTNKKETPYHSKLKSCLLCGCDLRAKVWFSPEVLRADAKAYIEHLPEHCWLKAPSPVVPEKTLD